MNQFCQQLSPRVLLSASLAPGFAISPLVQNLVAPTAMVVAPDGRIFVAEQAGDIRVIDNGVLQPTPFAHLHVQSTGDLGLLGITLDPDFTQNHWVYVYYTVGVDHGAQRFNRIARLTADGDTAVPASLITILNLDPLDPTSSFDDGGAIHFGPDGKLYIATGDDDNPDNSQSLSNLEGKILRVDPDGSIPSDNPFFNRAHGKNRLIWCLGLRNPFNFSFSADGSQMLINDVGSDLFEEVDQGAAGADFGWPVEEGPGSDPNFVNPLYAYPHPQGFCITGSAFFPAAAAVPAKYAGDYVFADLFGPSEDGSKSVAWIRTLNPNTHAVQTIASGLKYPVALAFSADGSMYVLSRGTSANPETQDASGSVSVIRYVNGRVPDIDSQPAARTVGVKQPVTFTVAAAGEGKLSYQWLRDGSPIAGATAASLSFTPTLADDDAVYSVRVTDAAGSITSAAATLHVVNAAPPQVRILTPLSTALFSGGKPITFSARATDAQDGVLHGAAYSWQINYDTADDSQPFLSDIAGASGHFTPSANPGDQSTDVGYTLTVTATDSLGLTATATRTIDPITVDLTVTSNVVGIPVAINGPPEATPQTDAVVVGVVQDLSAPTTEAFAGMSYTFERWSDGKPAAHLLRAPSRDTTFIAYYSRS